jgi:hypothetical protein
MPIPLITPLPVPPSRADATNFASRADAFNGALPTFQAEMNAASSAINSVYFPPIFRNNLINGDFSIWQRGTSQTSSGYGSDDRWTNSNAGSTKTHSRQPFTLGQTAVPGEPVYFSRTVVSSAIGAGSLVIKQQRIEGVRTFAGRNARVSFWAKADAVRPIAIDFLQGFGTGGSPSAVVSGIGAQKFNLTTSWQRFTATVAIPSIAGKTLGSNGDDVLEFTFWLDAGSTFNSRSASLGQQSGTFDLALVQIEEGAVDTAFEGRPLSIELALCQRYYEASAFYGSNYGLAGNNIDNTIYFRVPKRATPTIVFSNFSYSSASGIAAPVIDSQRFLIRYTATITTMATAFGDWSADAEL